MVAQSRNPDDDRRVAERRRLEELARGHLPYITPEKAVRVGAVLDTEGLEHDTGVPVNGIDPHRLHRQTRRERNRRRQRGEKVDTVPDALPDGPVVKSKSQHQGSRETIRRDAILERAVPLEPLMAHLVALCKARDVRRGDFIADYCAVLRRVEPLHRAVSEEELAEIAAREPFLVSGRTAYRWLSWGFKVFREWAAEEYLRGRTFTPTELEPMRLWLVGQAEGGPADDYDWDPEDEQ